LNRGDKNPGKPEDRFFIVNYLTISIYSNTMTISVGSDMLKQMEKIFKALGDKNRLRILNMLRNSPMCVCEITDVLSLSQSTVSGHLRVLKKIIEQAGNQDKNLEKERQLALRADRQVLCKK
jgi:DNA-binding transcriptional ArsR family regulator